jgi:hypothetical protein
MHKLDLAITSGKVWVQMNPNHVGELALKIPLFEPSGRSAGSTTITITNGNKVNLLENFEANQISGCEDLLKFISEGQIILVG